MGHQPFSLASPAANLKKAGAKVTCNDLAVDNLNEEAVEKAKLIGIYLQMHTATRLSISLLPRLKEINPHAHIAFYGLYAPLNSEYLQTIGGDSIIGGEFEDSLVEIYDSLAIGNTEVSINTTSTKKQTFNRPIRDDLPSLDRYAHLIVGDGSTKSVGYTETSRGCKHKCRHCPIVPVYNGRFRVIDATTVLADVQQQIESGAQHISFGDPDFLNGPKHAMQIVSRLHREFPSITYDVTIKIEHLLKHMNLIPRLKNTGCILITTAAESVEDKILNILQKGHTQEDFINIIKITRRHGIALSPTFVPFTPWTTKRGFLDLLDTIGRLELINNIAPIQLAIRLLIPNQSALLELKELKKYIKSYNQESLSYIWQNPDESVEELCANIQKIVAKSSQLSQSRLNTFKSIYAVAAQANDKDPTVFPFSPPINPTKIPNMSEPWFCCAEPTEDQLARL